MPPVPQRKRRSAGSTIKGNIRSRSEEEKGAKESRHRLPPAPARPGAGWCGAAEDASPSGGGSGGGGSGVGKRGWLLVFGAGGGSHSCSCTSGRHFVLRGRDGTRERHTQGSFPPRPPPPPSVGTDSPDTTKPQGGTPPPTGGLVPGPAAMPPPVARAPGRVFVSVSMWEKEEEEEEEAAICLLGWSPPGSTCSPHWGDGRGAVATPPPGPDYSLSPQRPRPPLGFRRRFAQVNSCSLFRRRRRRRRQVLSVSPPRSPPRRFLSGPRSPPRASLEFAPLWWQPPWVAVVLYSLPAGSGGGDWAPAGRPGRRRPGGECRPRASGIYLSSGIRRAPGWAELLLVGDRPRPGEEP